MEKSEFHAFYQAQWRPLVASLVKKTRNRAVAEDLAQDVFVRFFEKIETVSPDLNPGGLLYTMATNAAIDWKRKNRVVEVYEADRRNAQCRRWQAAFRDPSTLPEFDIASQDDKNRLLRAIWTLTPIDRTLVRLRFMADLPLKECSLIAGLSLGAVVGRINRAVSVLNKLIGHDFLITPTERKILADGTIPDFIDSLSENERLSLGLVLIEGVHDAEALETLKKVLSA